jgi:hypothetical protein
VEEIRRPSFWTLCSRRPKQIINVWQEGRGPPNAMN